MRIDFRELSIRFGKRVVVDRLTASFAWGDDFVIALMGPSGSGKTTLAREILNVHHGGHGKAALSIEPCDAVVAYLPQEPVLFGHLGLADNVRLLQRVGRYRERFDPQLCNTLVQSLRLDRLLASGGRADQLSGGEAQRLMLVRTLSVRPDLLILDEPAAGLDPAVREAFLIDLQALLARLSIRAIYITHHWDEVRFLAPRAAYAELSAENGAICRLEVVPREHFAAAPPSIDAFKTVYGPGCSVWPLVQANILACFTPPDGGANIYRRGADDFRIAEAIETRLARGWPVAAALYQGDRFLEWRDIDHNALRGL